MKKELVIFDVCNTLISGDSTRLYIDFLQQHGYKTFSHLSLFEGKLAQLFIGGLNRIFRYNITRNYMIHCFKGLSHKKLQNLQSAFNKMYFEKINQNLFQKIIEYKKADSDIVLLSASINPPIDALAEHLGINAYATKLEIKNDVYTGTVQYDLLGRKETVFIYGKHPKQYQSVTFYTDNIEDIGLIKYLQNNIPNSFFFIIIHDSKRKALWQKNLDKYTITHYEFIH